MDNITQSLALHCTTALGLISYRTDHLLLLPYWTHTETGDDDDDDDGDDDDDDDDAPQINNSHQDNTIHRQKYSSLFITIVGKHFMTA